MVTIERAPDQNYCLAFDKIVPLATRCLGRP